MTIYIFAEHLQNQISILPFLNAYSASEVSKNQQPI